MSDRDALVYVQKELSVMLGIVNAHLSTVVDTPVPPVDVRPPPVYTPAPPDGQKPAPNGINYGPDLTGTEGNASEARVYNIGAGSVTKWRYSGTGRKQFISGGLSTNNAPPYVWVWVENGFGYVTTPVKISGQNTAPVDPIDVNGEVWFCEQIDADPGTQWNRYAQVNPGAAAPTAGRGTIGPSVGTGRG